MHYISWSSGSYEYFTKEPDSTERDFESFTPSLPDLKEGYVVVIEYTTYDSYTEYSEVYRHVVDVFKESSEAEKCANGLFDLMDYQKNEYYTKDPKPIVLDAGGDQIGRVSGSNWGEKLSKIVIQYVLKDDVKSYRKELYSWKR